MSAVRHDAAMEAHSDPRNDLAALELLDALVAALDRRVEVGEAITSSADEHVAVRRLQDLLGVSESPAKEVLNMQWRRWTRDGQAELRSRRDELLARRDDLIARRDAMGQTD
jgi:DNA gyrase/topoisomerase IV subunit A